MSTCNSYSPSPIYSVSNGIVYNLSETKSRSTFIYHMVSNGPLSQLLAWNKPEFLLLRSTCKADAKILVAFWTLSKVLRSDLCVKISLGVGQGALMLLWVCRVCPDYWLLYIRMEGSYMFAVRAFQLKSMQECARREVIGCMAAEILKENCFVYFFCFWS